MIEEKYKSVKSHVEQYKQANRELKNKLRQWKERGRSRSRQPSRGDSRVEKMEMQRLKSVIDRLRTDANFQQSTNEELKRRLQQMQTQIGRQDFDKKYESERAKNAFLENENMRLQSQIREQSVKYKIQLDERNRSTVNEYVRKRTTNGAQNDERRLASENKNLRERLNSLNNELKMKKNISDAVVLKQEQVETLKMRVSQLEQENRVLSEKADSVEKHAKTLKDALLMRDSESADAKQNTDHLVQMYQRLYNDMKRQCEIYINKIEEMRHQMQNQAHAGNTLSYTKKVFQGSRRNRVTRRRPIGGT